MKRRLLYTILSISLLTVMAGAAIAPALGVISAHFEGRNPLFIQLIVSLPALFIILTNLVFPWLCRLMKTRTLALTGLALYVLSGAGAFFVDNIWMLLVFRALMGVSVGMIMPLSTGLMAYYFPPEEQAGLMGLSAAMNQMGGVVATFLAGVLAGISWNYAFLMKRFAAQMKYVAPLGFAAGYLCLAAGSGAMWLLTGSAFIGIANGIGVPYLNTIGSVKAGKEAATTVMPLLSAALYLGQFLSPLIVSPSARLMHTSPYFVGVGVSIIYLVQAILTRKQQMLPRI